MIKSSGHGLRKKEEQLSLKWRASWSSRLANNEEGVAWNKPERKSATRVRWQSREALKVSAGNVINGETDQVEYYRVGKFHKRNNNTFLHLKKIYQVSNIEGFSIYGKEIISRVFDLRQLKSRFQNVLQYFKYLFQELQYFTNNSFYSPHQGKVHLNLSEKYEGELPSRRVSYFYSKIEIPNNIQLVETSRNRKTTFRPASPGT